MRRLPKESSALGVLCTASNTGRTEILILQLAHPRDVWNARIVHVPTVTILLAPAVKICTLPETIEHVHVPYWNAV